LPFCHARLRGPRPLPRSYPQVLVTIGNHLRKRRLDLGLRQKDVARVVGADETWVTTWEKNRAEPSLRFLPRIMQFLDYAPSTNQGCVAARLLAYRRERGL